MLKRRALALAAVLTLGLIPTLPSYAVTTYASPADLIEDVVEVALTGVTSPTKGDALTEMKGKITLTGDEVFYDGTSIGYWYSEDSSTIYTTEAQADTVVVSDGSNGWEVEPLIFEDILSDVNEDLIENVVPTTADWSKIIGKYDVTLGGLTIPADQWVSCTPQTSLVSSTFNFSSYSGISGTNMPAYVNLFAYAITEDGKLYILNDSINLRASGTAFAANKFNLSGSGVKNFASSPTSTSAATITMRSYPIIYAEIVYNNGYHALNLHFKSTDGSDNGTILNNNTFGSVASTFHLYPDSTQKMTTEQLASVKDIGIMYTSDVSSNVITLSNVFGSASSSKKVVGNTTLTKRIAKLSNLTASDTIVFTASGWTVNGLEDLDSYISTSILTEAGQSATMDGAVEIEELNFKVVVPSTLPMIADSEGNVQVASNASIDNKSNAKVKITGLEIKANSESGWTMVDSNH